MTFTAFFLILLSVILHSTWNLILKKNQGGFASYALLNTPDLLLWAHLQFWSPVDVWHLPPMFYLMIFCGVICDNIYGQFVVRSYKRMDMSIAYPMMRSLPIIFTPALTTLLGIGAKIGWQAYVGMGVVFIGCLFMPLLKFKDLKLSNYLNRNIMFVIMVALGTTGYTIFDKQALGYLEADEIAAASPIMMALTYYSLRCVILNAVHWSSVMLMPSTRRTIIPTFRGHGLSLALAGVCSSSTYILVLVAMNHVTNVSFVQVFRQLGLPIGAAIAMLFLHEKCTRTKIVGMLLIFAGLALCVM